MRNTPLGNAVHVLHVLALERRRALARVLGTGLHAQAGREDELADGGAEAAQEGVEGLVRFRMYVSVWLLFGVFVLMSGNCMHVFTHRG